MKSKHINETQVNFDFERSILFSFGALTLSGADNPPHTLSTRVLLAGFWFFSAILFMTYQASLSATSTISRLDSSISSLLDLAKQQQVTYSCTSGTTVQTYFEEMSAIEETFYNFWKNSCLTSTILDLNCEDTKFSNCAFRRDKKNKDSTIFGTLEYKSLWEYPLSNTYTVLSERIKKIGYVNNTADGLNRVLNAPIERPFAFICEYPIALYETNLNCDLEIVGNQFSARPYALGLRKGNPLKQSISDTILKLQRDLELDLLKNKWWGTRSKCKIKDSLITLNVTGGAFIIMCFAIVLALIVLFVNQLNKKTYFKNKSSSSSNAVKNDFSYKIKRFTI